MSVNIDPAYLPLDVPAAREIVRRLCQLQREIIEVIDPRWDNANDCFCGESGFWPLRSPGHFRSAGTAIDFIEETVRERLSEIREASA